jgi:hypothetical protein
MAMPDSMSVFKSWRLRVIMILVALAVVMSPLLYVAQEQGVCLKAGRVLSAEELRRRVLLNVISHEIENTISINRRRDGDHSQLGIASPARETDARKLLDISFYSEKSLEETFGLEMLVLGRRNIPAKDYDLTNTKEPFILMSYDTRSEGVDAYISSDIREIKLTEFEIAHELRNKYEFSWYERLLGYGKHFFNIPIADVVRSREVYQLSNKYTEQERYARQEQERHAYQEQKHRAYVQLTRPEFLAIMAAERKHLAMVTNCGGLLVTEINDPDFSSSIIIKRISWNTGE